MAYIYQYIQKTHVSINIYNKDRTSLQLALPSRLLSSGISWYITMCKNETQFYSHETMQPRRNVVQEHLEIDVFVDWQLEQIPLSLAKLTL